MDYQAEDFRQRAWEDEEDYSDEEEVENIPPQYLQYEEVRPFPPAQQMEFPAPQPPAPQTRNPRTPKTTKADALPAEPGVFCFGKTQSADAYLSRTWDLWSAQDIQTDKEKLR